MLCCGDLWGAFASGVPSSSEEPEDSSSSSSSSSSSVWGDLTVVEYPL